MSPSDSTSEQNHTAAPARVDLSGAQGVVIGTNAKQHNRFLAQVMVPRSVEITVIAILVIASFAATTWAVVALVLPHFAPLYRTEFVIDTSAASSPQASRDIASSLKSAVANSGDKDALALRSFGGTCAEPGNTRQLERFSTDNQESISRAAAAAKPSGAATLQRGIVQAIEDFANPWSGRARLGNRIIVVTRNAVDACDSDVEFLRNDIQRRITAAGVEISFRVVGYQVAQNDRSGLDAIFAGAGDTPPAYADTPRELYDVLEWYTNVEPIITSANQIVDILNPTAGEVGKAAQAVHDGRLDTAADTLDRAADRLSMTDDTFAELESRTNTPTGRDLRTRADRLRRQQQELVQSGRMLMRQAARKRPLNDAFEDFGQAAARYNTEADGLNRVVRELRARAPRGES